MKRGDLYRVYRGSENDPKKFRVYLVVSRQELLDGVFSTVVCAPIYSRYCGYATQVEVDVEDGLKHDSAVFCDELVSLPKSKLTGYIGALSPDKMQAVNIAIRIALATG